MLNVIGDSLLGKRGAASGNSPTRGKKEKTELEENTELAESLAEANAPGWVSLLIKEFEKLATKVDQIEEVN